MPPRLAGWRQARTTSHPHDRAHRRGFRSKIALVALLAIALVGFRSAADWLSSPTTLTIGGLSLHHPFAANDSGSGDDSGSSRGSAADVAPEPAAPVPAGGQPVALVYDNPPFADDDNAQELGGMLQKSKYRFRVVYVGPKHTPLTADLLGHSALFAFPGGDVETTTAKRDFAQEIPLVQQFVAGGGHYLGVCAGGFVAGADGFGVFPGEVGSYIDSPGAQFTDDKDHAVQITWRGQQQRSVDFQDGNYIKIPPGTHGVTVLGTYSNGLPAAAVATHGRGKAAFTGPHFESATDDNKHPAALDLDWQLLDTLMSPSNTPS